MFAVDNLFCHVIGPLLLSLRIDATDDAQYFVFSHDDVFLTIELDLLPRVLAEEDEVTSLDVGPLTRAVVLDLASACGDHLALLRLLLGGVGDDDPADLL